MYERSERKTTTQPDGTSEHHEITQKSSSGLTELFLIPIGMCLTAVICGLILQIGIKLSHSINPGNTPSSVRVYHKTEGS